MGGARRRLLRAAASLSVAGGVAEYLSCDDGPAVVLSFPGLDEDADGTGQEGTCRVAVARGAERSLSDEYDHVITDSLGWAGWLGRTGNAYFLDAASWRLEDGDRAFKGKTRVLSILFPPQELWDGLTEALYAEAMSLRQAVFIDDGRDETHEAAVQGSRFVWIVEDRNESIHPAFVRAMGHHTIPVFSGWVLYTNMFHNSVLRYPKKRGAVVELIWQLRMMIGNNEDITMGKYHHTILDILVYRYRVPLAERLRTAACVLCRPRSSLAVVGVYSALRNSDRRAAIRETWGRLLAQEGISLQFFLGESAAPGSSGDDAGLAEANAQAAAEAEAYGDIVRLPVPEGYVHNARKGLAFLRYLGEYHKEAAFCIKVDDDIYWRPEPLLRMLRARTPYRYIWGFLDLNSPVPREEKDAFYHTKEEWPDEIFPPYPRGALRVISMDIVGLLAAAHERLHVGVTGDDPSLGVHLRQLVMQDGTFLQLDDRGANSRFAMEPTCLTEGVYCPMKPTTWIAHHVSGRAIRCMFRADVRAGYYRREAGGAFQVEHAEPFPSLCSCVDGRWTRSQYRRRRRLRLQPSPATQCPRPPEGGLRV